MQTKLAAVATVAFGLSLIPSALADNDSDLAAQGYRWAIVEGPYACTTSQGVQRIVAHHTDGTELHVVENLLCYYLIPGAIVQVNNDDPAHGPADVRLEGFPGTLWTYTRFLSKHPVHDSYGVVETPKNAGPARTVHVSTVPVFPNGPRTRTRRNGNP